MVYGWSGIPSDSIKKKFELGLIDLEFKLFPFFDIFEIPNASFVRFDNFIFWPFERAISN